MSIRKNKEIRFSLKVKFSLMISILITLIVLIIGYMLIEYQKKKLTDEIIKRGGVIVKNFANITLENYLTGDVFSIIVYCKNLLKEDGVKEAFFLTKEGFIVAHSDNKMITPEPDKTFFSSEDESKPSSKYNKPFFHKGKFLKEGSFGFQMYDNNKSYDIYAPVRFHKKYFGTVHIIFSRDVIFNTIKEAKKKVIYISIFTLIIGLLGSFILANSVVKPVRKLSEGARIIGEGNLDYKIYIKSRDELGFLALRFNEMTSKLKEAQKVLVEKEKMEKEMQIAADIQQMLLPKIYPEFNNLEFGGFYQATKEVGGDYYDFIKISNNKLGIIVADVSGKGVPGALVMSMFRSILRSTISSEIDSYETLCRVNDLIYNDLKPGMFITVFYGILNVEKRTLDYSIAGHDPLIIYNSETEEFNLYKPEGISIGIEDNLNFRKILTKEVLSIKKGDLIVQYTDGINEAMNAEREQFGDERFYNAIKKYGNLNPSEFVKAIEKEVKLFTQNAPQSDDITLLAVKLIKNEFYNENSDIPLAEPL